MKKLLDGTLDPVELENNPHLYVLAERIYGREALLEMDILGPKININSLTEERPITTSDVEIPEFLPDINSIVKNQDSTIKKRRKMILLIGFTGLLTIITNIYFGMGKILCSLGLANMKEVCTEGNTRVVWLRGTSWDGLHQIETWKEPGSLEFFDTALIVLFSLMSIIGIFVKKKINTS
jgi:hypothetical protein